MSLIELNKIEKNKQVVLEAFDTLFKQHDYVAAEHYWSPKYIPHPSLKPRQSYTRVRREERA
jgi:predicted SnoaL-like aldol condensation-catalyzing enzyme